MNYFDIVHINEITNRSLVSYYLFKSEKMSIIASYILREVNAYEKAHLVEVCSINVIFVGSIVCHCNMTRSNINSNNNKVLLEKTNSIKSSSIDLELSKIHSSEKRHDVYNILHSSCPDHYSRLWLAGFLKHVGYTLDEICSIIDKEACWDNYSAVMTYNQVNGLFRGLKRIQGDISSQVSFPQSFLSSKEKAYNGKVPYCTLVYTPCSKCPEKCTLKAPGGIK